MVVGVDWDHAEVKELSCPGEVTSVINRGAILLGVVPIHPDNQVDETVAFRYAVGWPRTEGRPSEYWRNL